MVTGFRAFSSSSLSLWFYYAQEYPSQDSWDLYSFFNRPSGTHYTPSTLQGNWKKRSNGGHPTIICTLHWNFFWQTLINVGQNIQQLFNFGFRDRQQNWYQTEHQNETRMEVKTSSRSTHKGLHQDFSKILDVRRNICLLPSVRLPEKQNKKLEAITRGWVNCKGFGFCT